MSQTNVQIPAPSTSFRILASSPPPVGIAPTFLCGPAGSRYMYSMGIIYDALFDGTGYAIRAGLPSKAPPDALRWIGLDRQIFQGPNEPNSTYVQRLIQWLDLWAHAGSSMATLLGILAYLYPLTPKVLTVQTTGKLEYSVWDTYPAGSTPFPPGQQEPTSPVHDLIAGGNWRWDSLDTPFYAPWMYWRQWPVVFSPGGSPWPAPTKVWASGGALNVAIVSDPVYGKVYQNQSPASAGPNTFNWGDGTCWGWGGPAADAAAMRNIAAQWKSGGCWVPWIVVTYDATMFDETQAFGSPKLPDGHWGYNGKVVADATYGEVYTPARPSCSVCTFIAGPDEGGGVLGLG